MRERLSHLLVADLELHLLLAALRGRLAWRELVGRVLAAGAAVGAGAAGAAGAEHPALVLVPQGCVQGRWPAADEKRRRETKRDDERRRETNRDDERRTETRVSGRDA
jgi:hypothetical protein